jgi:hypothetical protein
MINDNSRVFAQKRFNDLGISKEEQFKKLYQNKEPLSLQVQTKGSDEYSEID